MRAKEIRELTMDEARQKERELAEEVFQLRMRKNSGQLDNSGRLRQLGRDLARVKTILHERSRRTSAEG